MRNLIVIFLFVFIGNTFSQYNEFKVYDNGLIYSEETMASLKTIADSLNLRYLKCNIDYNYSSLNQGMGHHMKLRDGDLKSAKIDIKNGINFEDFVAKYPKAKVKKDLLIVQYEEVDKNGKPYSDFNEIGLDRSWSQSIEELYDFKNTGKKKNLWISKYFEKNEYSEAYISAFFLPRGLGNTVIPKKYAEMIGYSNCMIDTTISKITEDAEYGHIDLPKDWQKYSEIEKIALLDSFRNKRVMGFCSQDQSPRIHAKNIALISSEVADWKVFLKAHLDILNDRFERASDGNYAWHSRSTYLKEIEELDINTMDLLFGTLFRIKYSSDHHYFGSPRRIGRALTDAADRMKVEQLMSSMIEDKDLDLFNRVLVYFTFNSYIYNLKDKAVQKAAAEKLIQSISVLPEKVRNKISKG